MQNIDITIGVNPCKDCTQRSATCHGTCQAYKKWAKENQERNQRIRTLKAYDAY